jgi:hypothetical protein
MSASWLRAMMSERVPSINSSDVSIRMYMPSVSGSMSPASIRCNAPTLRTHASGSVAVSVWHAAPARRDDRGRTMATCMLIVSEPIASSGRLMPRIMEMALVQLTSDVAYITLSYPLLPSFSCTLSMPLACTPPFHRPRAEPPGVVRSLSLSLSLKRLALSRVPALPKTLSRQREGVSAPRRPSRSSPR